MHTLQQYCLSSRKSESSMCPNFIKGQFIEITASPLWEEHGISCWECLLQLSHLSSSPNMPPHLPTAPPSAGLERAHRHPKDAVNSGSRILSLASVSLFIINGPILVHHSFQSILCFTLNLPYETYFGYAFSQYFGVYNRKMLLKTLKTVMKGNISLFSYQSR